MDLRCEYSERGYRIYVPLTGVTFIKRDHTTYMSSGGDYDAVNRARVVVHEDGQRVKDEIKTKRSPTLQMSLDDFGNFFKSASIYEGIYESQIPEIFKPKREEWTAFNQLLLEVENRWKLLHRLNNFEAAFNTSLLDFTVLDNLYFKAKDLIDKIKLAYSKRTYTEPSPTNTDANKQAQAEPSQASTGANKQTQTEPSQASTGANKQTQAGPSQSSTGANKRTMSEEPKHNREAKYTKVLGTLMTNLPESEMKLKLVALVAQSTTENGFIALLTNFCDQHSSESTCRELLKQFCRITQEQHHFRVPDEMNEFLNSIMKVLVLALKRR